MNVSKRISKPTQQKQHGLMVVFFLLGVLVSSSVRAQEPDRTILPIPESPFKGARPVSLSTTRKWAKAKSQKTVAGRFGADTFGIGEDTGAPVTFDYEPPFAFTGTIEKVTVELK